MVTLVIFFTCKKWEMGNGKWEMGRALNIDRAQKYCAKKNIRDDVRIGADDQKCLPGAPHCYAAMNMSETC